MFLYEVAHRMRLVVLMVEVEQPEGISARKLILEAARHNVISAYNCDDAAELLRRFPNVDLAVVHTELIQSSCQETIRQLKSLRPDLAIIAISPVEHQRIEGVDYVLSSHDPQILLKLLEERFDGKGLDES